MRADRPVENVWDYPRPPSIETSDERIVIELGGHVIADASRSLRVCETSHPPTYYLPAEVAGRRLLRGLDHLQGHRAVQGRTGHDGLVSPIRRTR